MLCHHQTIPIVLGLCGDCESVPPLVLSHFLVAVLQFMPNHEGDRQLHSSVSLLAQMIAQGNDKYMYVQPDHQVWKLLRFMA